MTMVHEGRLTQDSQAVVRGWAGLKTVARLGRGELGRNHDFGHLILDLAGLWRPGLSFGIIEFGGAKHFPPDAWTWVLKQVLVHH